MGYLVRIKHHGLPSLACLATWTSFRRYFPAAAGGGVAGGRRPGVIPINQFAS